VVGDLSWQIEENVMKAVLALVIAWTVLALEMVTPAPAGEVSVSYVPPKNPAHQPIFEQLKENRFLEKLQEFVSPFRLPRTLLVRLEGCDGDPNASYGNDTIVVCYEYVDELWKAMPAETTTAGVAPIDTLVGPLFDTCLHEFAHALFDMLQVPVLGREEDAADQVSAYIMLHLGKSEARRLIAGTSYAYKTEAEAATAPFTVKQFADAHGTPAQRFYNLLCIAYGADPQLFGDMAETVLPKERAEDCNDEYRQLVYAYEKLIRPHIDQDLANKLFDKSWLPDATTGMPRRPVPAQPK
jgi:Putative metallopeptidase